MINKDKDIVKGLERKQKDDFAKEQKIERTRKEDIANQERSEKLKNRMNRIVKLDGKIQMTRTSKPEVKQKKQEKQPSKEELEWLRYLGNFEKQE